MILALAPAAAMGAEPHPLRHDLRVDGAITTAALAAWVTSELAKPSLGPTECRICETNGLDAGARDLLVWKHGFRARRTSDVLAFAVVPGGVVAHQILAARAAGDVESGFVDVLLVAEATALALDLNQVVKYAAGRQRPFVRYGNWDGREPSHDDNLSFYSGHTALAFSLATAAGTVSTLRGYRSAPWVWGTGMAAASVVGYLRIAGDMHYLTDVLTGAALGAAMGFAVPWFAHGREEGASESAGAAVMPVPLGVVVVF
jgi:membrane-associated phospholipid phosphatase